MFNSDNLDGILAGFSKPLEKLKKFIIKADEATEQSVAHEVELEQRLIDNKKVRRKILKKRHRAEKVIENFNRFLEVNEEEDEEEEEEVIPKSRQI